MDKTHVFWLSMILVSFGLTGCVPTRTESAPSDDEFLQSIVVEDVRVEIGVGSPIPVDVVVAGTWPDLCAQLARIDQTIDETEIRIELLSTPVDDSCPPDQVGLPFRIALPLNVVELPEGSYTVNVNGFETTFSWPAQS